MTYLSTDKVELGHNDLISNISLMQWNLRVQIVPNYFLGMALHVSVLIRS